MKHTLLAVIAILVASLLVVPAQAAVTNINLAPVGDSGVSGTATAITGDISGANPYTNTEINVRLGRTPAANMVYEGWLVDNDSNYKLSLGAFDGMRLSFAEQLVEFSPYDAVAVSVEPINDTNPMPATIVAMGNLPGSTVSAADFARTAVLPQDEMFQQQVIMQRFGLTSDQVRDLRMMGWGYSDIAVVANAASRCNRSATDIANILMQGQTWDQIASTCNTTVAQLLEPVPVQAVAGFRGEVTPGMVQTPMWYRTYPNGRPVVAQDDWMQYWRRGYDWRDVAVAANIAAMTGDNVDDLLRMRRIQGMTWQQIAIQRGVRPSDVTDVSRWPFGTSGEEFVPTTTPVPSEVSPPPAGTTPPTMAPPPSGPTY